MRISVKKSLIRSLQFLLITVIIFTMEKVKILLGKRVKELREKRKMSQQQLAELVGVDQRNLSKIECGVVFPSKCLDKLGSALEISLPDIFDFEHLDLSVEEKKEFIKVMLDELSEDKLTFLFRLIKSL